MAAKTQSSQNLVKVHNAIENESSQNQTQAFLLKPTIGSSQVGP